MFETSRQNFDCPTDLWKEVRVHAATEGITMSEYMVRIMCLGMGKTPDKYLANGKFKRTRKRTEPKSKKPKNK